MKRLLGMLSLLLIVFVGLTACSTGTGEAMLEDTERVLESYGEPGNLKGVIADTKITVEFVSAEDTIKGSAGCNHYSGGYEIKGRQLTIPGPIAATEMSCGEDIDKQEREYLSTLQTARSYNVADGGLTIICGAQFLVFKSKYE